MKNDRNYPNMRQLTSEEAVAAFDKMIANHNEAERLRREKLAEERAAKRNKNNKN
jgi:hypothetical protein